MTLEFRSVVGTMEDKPKEIDSTSSSDFVYIRKDIEQVERKEDDRTIKEWHYKEAELTKAEYETLAPFIGIEKKQDASADNLGIIMDALADLYEQVLSSTEEGGAE